MATENTGYSGAKVRGDYPSFKHALVVTLHRSTKSIDGISEDLGRAYSTVQKWGDLFAPDNYPPAALFPLLAQVADNPAWLDFLEVRAGRVAFTLPKGSGATVKQTAEICLHVAAVLKRIADADVDGDGVHSAAERAAASEGVTRDCRALIAAVAGVIELFTPNADGFPREVVKGGQR